MTVFTYSQARQNLATLLTISRREGEVLIKKKDGAMFCLKPARMKKSPLDIKGIKSKVSTEEIIKFVRESRNR